VILPVFVLLVLWACVTLAAVDGASTDDARSDEAPSSVGVSDVTLRERIVFFTTSARLGADDATWILPLHGWIHQPEDSYFRKGAFRRLLRTRYGLDVTDATRANFDRRANLFLVDNERGRRIVVRIGSRRVVLGPSEPTGHFTGEVEVPRDEVASLASDGAVLFDVALPHGDSRTFGGRVLLVEPEGLSVLSDLDDTVKITEVSDVKSLFDRTFLRDFEAVPGMAERYRAWTEAGASIHFVSTSPWHLYEPLDEFLTESGFPRRTLSLEMVRFKDSSFWNLLRTGADLKPEPIRAILDAYPARRFLLVGDDSEHDPEIYASFARERPEQIARIFIRSVTGAPRSDARFRTAFEGVPADTWSLFTDPASLSGP
jgi:phosphatidate phosphatase APP1